MIGIKIIFYLKLSQLVKAAAILDFLFLKIQDGS